MAQNFSKLVKDRMKQLGWTPYRLAQEVEEKATKPTVYSFLSGKPVRSDTLAAIFEAVGLVVSEKD